MKRKSFEALNKAKKQEATARAAKRKAVSAMKDEYYAGLRKHFPKLEESKTVNGETVPVVDDLDKFFEELVYAHQYYAAVRKYFPELVDGKTVNGETVPVVDDVDKFFKEVAYAYRVYKRRGESSTGHQQDAGNTQSHSESSRVFPSTGNPQGVSTVEPQ